MKKNIFLLIYLCVSASALSQSSIDSTSDPDNRRLGFFRFYATKLKIGVIAELIRDREHAGAFQPLGLTYYVYLPYEYSLNYTYAPSRDKVFTINAVGIIHHSMYGNYGIGAGLKFSFLLVRRVYLSYQLGVAWFGVVDPKAKDGLSNEGFNFHHNAAISYAISNRFEASLHALHISNGGLLGKNGNLQDAIGIGVSYQVQQ